MTTSSTIMTLSKLSLAVVLLNTSIYVTPDSHADYLEDDVAFTQVSDTQSSGWHWGVNSAYADCNNAQSFSDCIPVYGQDPGDIDYGYGDFGGVGYGDYESGGGSDGESGGGGSSGNSSPPPDNTNQIEQCKETAQNNKNQCFENADNNYGLLLFGCGFSSNYVLCKSSADISWEGNKRDCTITYSNAIAACD